MGNYSSLEFDTFYHIYSRGNNKEAIFYEERNYHYFLECYAKYIEQIAETFAYCLLKNHFHLLVKIRPENDISKNPSQQFSHFLNSYSKAINKAYDHIGSLFQHPFGRRAILSNDQFHRTIAYIHQNPIKHRFVLNRGQWEWSSYYEVSKGKYQLIKPSTLEETFGGVENYLAIEYPIQFLNGIDDF
jgi:REP element-mobilizing transposase RayT